MAVDTIADFLTVIRNGLMVSKSFVRVPASRMKGDISRILKQEGFIRDYVVEAEGTKQYLKIFLKYVEGESVIHEIKRLSKSGCRVYTNIASLRPVIGGLGIAILSTNRGIMTDKTARAMNVGGELICEVW